MLNANCTQNKLDIHPEDEARIFASQIQEFAYLLEQHSKALIDIANEGKISPHLLHYISYSLKQSSISLECVNEASDTIRILADSTLSMNESWGPANEDSNSAIN